MIVVCSDDEKVKYFYGERGKIYAIQNTAAAIQNILLLAYEKGYGTCWIGSFNDEEVKKILDIPKNINIHAIITIGIPDENPPVPSRIPLQEKVFFERWGNKLYKPELYPIMENIRNVINYLKNL